LLIFLFCVLHFGPMPLQYEGTTKAAPFRYEVYPQACSHSNKYL
jgi:hypothetical protein